ncbi:MAG: peptidase M14, partial [Bacteroidales bacterium]|nr:peptidase M14 [Bacteroidales bacterium]
MMKRALMCLLFLITAYGFNYAQGKELIWYMPEGVENFNSKIPAPEKVLGFKSGERHITYDQVLIYMRRLAELSPRVKIIEQGYTYEKNPLIYLIISTPENLENLESIRTERLKIA